MSPKAELKRIPGGRGASGIARPAAYIKRVAKPGLKPIKGASGASSGFTMNCVVDAAPRIPVTPAASPSGPRKMACSFVDSVISFLSRSSASCGEIGDPVPEEFIFLQLVRLCGVIEAKYWADRLGLPSAHSYGLIEQLLYGPRK